MCIVLTKTLMKITTTELFIPFRRPQMPVEPFFCFFNIFPFIKIKKPPNALIFALNAHFCCFCLLLFRISALCCGFSVFGQCVPLVWYVRNRSKKKANHLPFPLFNLIPIIFFDLYLVINYT